MSFTRNEEEKLVEIWAESGETGFNGWLHTHDVLRGWKLAYLDVVSPEADERWDDLNLLSGIALDHHDWGLKIK